MAGAHLIRLAALGALAAAVAGCGGSNDSESTVAATTTTAVTTTATTTAAATTTTATTTAATTTTQLRRATVVTIDVVDGKPEGGIARPSVEHDDRVVIVVHSDTADEVHVHGYDIAKNVTAGGTVRIPFTATTRGRFEIELENTGVQIAELTVT
jgi:hypothetical protein